MKDTIISIIIKFVLSKDYLKTFFIDALKEEMLKDVNDKMIHYKELSDKFKREVAVLNNTKDKLKKKLNAVESKVESIKIEAKDKLDEALTHIEDNAEDIIEDLTDDKDLIKDIARKFSLNINDL